MRDSAEKARQPAMCGHGDLVAARHLPPAGIGAAHLTEIETTTGCMTVYGVYEDARAGLPVYISGDGLRVHVGGLGRRSFVRAPVPRATAETR